MSEPTNERLIAELLAAHREQVVTVGQLLDYLRSVKPS